MGFKAEVNSIEINGGIFKVGDTIYDTTNIGRWEPERRLSYDFFQRGLTRTINKIVLEDIKNDFDENETQIYAISYKSCSNDNINLKSSSIWHKKECALEYCDLAYEIHSKGEEYRKEHWLEYCEKLEALRKKDCS